MFIKPSNLDVRPYGLFIWEIVRLIERLKRYNEHLDTLHLASLMVNILPGLLSLSLSFLLVLAHSYSLSLSLLNYMKAYCRYMTLPR